MDQAPMTEERIQYLLRSWRTLLGPGGLNSLTEGEVWDLLQYEREHLGRSTILLRLHGRYNTLRTRREKGDLLEAAKE